MAPRPKPKYLEPQHAGQRERWQVSYTDFVTVLLILFVAIAAQGLHSSETPRPQQTAQRKAHPPAAQSAVDHATQADPAPKPEPPQAAGPAPELTSPPAPQTTADPALIQANEKFRAKGLDSHLEKRGLVVSLPQAVLFPSGEDHVTVSALPVVSQIAEVIATLPNRIALVGHADSVPVHNKRFSSNWELAAARSVNLLQVLHNRYGIDESRLSAQSYGANDPKDSNDTPSGRAENRRVEILLLDESGK